MSDIAAYPIEPPASAFPDGTPAERFIVLQTRWGGQTLDLSEANELLIALFRAIRRARDPEPLPEPEAFIPPAARGRKPLVSSTSLDDIL